MKKQFRKIDIVVFVFTGLVIVGMFLYLAIAWKSIPDRIPANFTTSGEILTYESKGYLFSVPIALLLMSSVLIVAGCIPSAWNIPKVKITPKNDHAASDYHRDEYHLPEPLKRQTRAAVPSHNSRRALLRELHLLVHPHHPDCETDRGVTP